MASEIRKVKSQPGTVRRGPKPNPHTRTNLIRVGARMFHETGYTATGVKDIVDEAKVPKGSFYNHFESKEAFGKEVVDFYFGSGLDALHELLRNSSVLPIERLRNFFAARIRDYQANGYTRGCMMGNLSLEVADHSASIRGQLAMHFKTWSSLFEACIVEAQNTGAIISRLPAPLLARFLVNSWEGALLQMRVEKSDVPLQEFLEVTFGSLLT